MPAPDVPRSERVPAEQAGIRLDMFLARWLAVSRREARSLLSQGKVHEGDRALGLGDKGEPLAGGSLVTVSGFVPPHERRVATATTDPDGPLASLLAEGPDWVAIDKPAGMPVHPYHEGETATALGFVAARRPEIHGVGEGGLRSGVVHRLDIDTSGVLLLATAQGRWERLRAAFGEGRVEKVYRGIALGELREARDLRLHVRVAQHRPARVRVVSADNTDAREIFMRVRPLESLTSASLVEITPTSGFLHQIRVALAHIGHPLAGDHHYGSGEDDTGARRHMLHASRLQIDEIVAESPDPADFLELAARLRSRAS